MAAKKSTRKTKPTKTKTRTSKAAPKTNGAQTSTFPWSTVTVHLAVNSASRAIGWYAKALGAKVLTVNEAPGGKIMHAELRVGDTRIMLADVFPGSDLQDPETIGGTTTTLHLYTKNIDQAWRKAVDAGATVVMPLENQFWGERYGKLRDPFGHSWSLSYPVKMTAAEMKRKQDEAMRMFSQGEHVGMEATAR